MSEMSTRAFRKGATNGEKLAPKSAPGAGAPGAGTEAIARAAELQTLALAGILIQRTVTEISQRGLGVQQTLLERLSALSKTAVEAGNDIERILKTVPAEIESATAELERVCNGQLVFWNEIAQRTIGIGVLRKMMAPKSKSQLSQSKTV